MFIGAPRIDQPVAHRHFGHFRAKHPHSHYGSPFPVDPSVSLANGENATSQCSQFVPRGKFTGEPGFYPLACLPIGEAGNCSSACLPIGEVGSRRASLPTPSGPALRVASVGPVPIGVTDQDRRDFRLLLVILPALFCLVSLGAALAAVILAGAPA
jgi:hypothetical protein